VNLFAYPQIGFPLRVQASDLDTRSSEEAEHAQEVAPYVNPREVDFLSRNRDQTKELDDKRKTMQEENAHDNALGDAWVIEIVGTQR